MAGLSSGYDEMCGIVGIIGTPGKQLHDIFENLLSLGLMRGKDSTGVAAISLNKKRATIVKDVLFPLELIRSREYQNKITRKRNEIFCLIGHNRAATRGEIEKENAHPFAHEHIVLVHNGTLIKDFDIDSKDFETDSEGLTYSLSKIGVKRTWRELDGAAALLYFDFGHTTLNVITNGKRPIHFVMLKDRQFLLIASEFWMLNVLIEHMDLKFIGEHILYPKENILFSFKRNPETGILSYKTKKLESKPPFDYFYGKKSKKDGHIWPIKKEAEIETERLIRERQAAFGFQGHHILDDEDDGEITDLTLAKLQKKDITEEEFNEKYKKCSLCFEGLEGEYVTSVIVDEDIAVCESCTLISDEHDIDLATLRGA